jgi:hypothetical protein
MRKITRAELEAYIAKASAENDAWAAESAKHHAEHEAWRRHFEADKLVRELYGSSYGHDELVTAIEMALADLPTAPLDDAELARLKRRHLALRLVEKIAALKGPLNAPTEMALFETFQKALAAPIKIQEGTTI